MPYVSVCLHHLKKEKQKISLLITSWASVCTGNIHKHWKHLPTQLFAFLETLIPTLRRGILKRTFFLNFILKCEYFCTCEFPHLIKTFKPVNFRVSELRFKIWFENVTCLVSSLYFPYSFWKIVGSWLTRKHYLLLF